MDDAFAHVQTLSEHFFVNTFTGAIVSKINRARQKIESFEDQILIRVIPTIVVLAGSTIFLALRFPGLAALMIVYVVLLFGVSAYFVFRISGPAQGIYAAAQDSFIAHLADSIGGMSTTKAYAQEQMEIANFLDVTEELREKNERSYKLGSYAAIVQRLLLTRNAGAAARRRCLVPVQRQGQRGGDGLPRVRVHDPAVIRPRPGGQHQEHPHVFL